MIQSNNACGPEATRRNITVPVKERHIFFASTRFRPHSATRLWMVAAGPEMNGGVELEIRGGILEKARLSRHLERYVYATNFASPTAASFFALLGQCKHAARGYNLKVCSCMRSCNKWSADGAKK